MKADTSLLDFIAQHRKILNKLDPTNELEKVEVFVAGLPPRLAKEIALRYPSSIEVAFDIAKALDSGGGLESPMEIGAVGSKEKIKCFYCKKTGHIKRDCFKLKQSKTIGDKKIQVGAVELNLVKSKKLFVVNGNIHGKKLKILVNSGAQCNLISEEIGKSLPIPMLKSDVMLKVKNGGILECSGYFKSINLNLEQNWQENIDCVIWKSGLKYDLILGMPWFEANNPDINWVDKEIRLAKNGKDYILKEAGNTGHISALSFEVDSDRVADNWDYVLIASIEKSISITSVVDDDKIKKWKNQYPEVFGDQTIFPPKRDIEHKIVLNTNDPVYRKTYPMSPLVLKALKESLDELLAKGFIRLSDSPYSLSYL